jgi:hypothetical protein
MSSREAEASLRRVARLTRAWRALEESPGGKMVLGDLLGACGVLEVSHTPGDSHDTAYRDGRRSIGLHVLERLRWTETELVELARRRSAEMIDEAGNDFNGG